MRRKLVEVRLAKGMTPKEAAARIRISRTHYGQIEAGDKTPSLEVALRIKQVFGYENDDIFLNSIVP